MSIRVAACPHVEMRAAVSCASACARTGQRPSSSAANANFSCTAKKLHWIFPALPCFARFAEQPDLFGPIRSPRPKRGNPGNCSSQRVVFHWLTLLARARISRSRARSRGPFRLISSSSQCHHGVAHSGRSLLRNRRNVRVRCRPTASAFLCCFRCDASSPRQYPIGFPV